MREIYLAGPITGLSYGESTDWRSQVASQLPSHIRPLSPMRGKQYLKGEATILDSYSQHIMSTSKGITTRDRFDVARADAVFANFLGAKKVSIGTVIEIAWADMLRKPIIVVMEKDNVHQHSMLNECAGFITESLDEAISVAVRLLSDGV